MMQMKLGTIIVALMLILQTATMGYAWEDSSWAYRKTITVDSAQVSGTQANYPLLVALNDADLAAHAQVDGDDIYFTTTGDVRIPHEVESYASGALVAWVLLPTISASSDTEIYMYYGNPSASAQEDPEAVWGSDYLAVHHLENLQDSSPNNNDGTAENGASPASGKIDGAYEFDGLDDRINLGQLYDSEGQYTFEAWVNSGAKQGYAVSQFDTSLQGSFLQYYPNSFQIYSDGTHVVAPATTGQWHYLAGTYDGSQLSLYVDGALRQQSAASITWPNRPAYIGDRAEFSRGFLGSIDEVRLSSTARSADYISTNYNNQNSPGSFVSLSGQEAYSGASAPSISAPDPANVASDVPLTLTELSFTITDSEAMDYTVTTSPDIGSDSGIGVSSGTYSVPVSGLAAGTLYTWTVQVTDGVDTTESVFQFTTVTPSGDVTISNPVPASGDATYNPMLSVQVQADSPVEVYFEVNRGSGWDAYASQVGGSGKYQQPTSGMDTNGQTYQWRVNVNDGSGWVTEEYSFRALPFILKWRHNTGARATLGTLAVDLNDDGIFEVFANGQGAITAIDGATGNRLWQYNNPNICDHCPFELGDLDNDGQYEIVSAALLHTIALNAEDGSVLWDIPVESADKYLVIVDTDGNHLPYVYTTSSDVEHWDEGTGRLRKIRGYDGAVMAETFAWRPCWGGLSAADLDNDGKMEIVMTDRDIDYHPPTLAKGTQVYDADTLELKWYNDEVLSSSHTAALIDMNDDGVLDAVTLEQITRGFMALDGLTGEPLPMSVENSNLKSHSQFSIWDIDEDGSLEVVTCENSPIQIWDVDKQEVEATLDQVGEPPKMIDVMGDDSLELVSGDYITRVYDNQYNLIYTFQESSRALPLVQDIDNDGQNELILLSGTGQVSVYETSAYTPTPKLRTNTLYYSERNLGVGVYVPPPGAPQPFALDPYPADGAEDIPLNPTLSFRAVDYHYDLMNVVVEKLELGSWVKIAEWNDVENGELTVESGMVKPDTQYFWRVTVSDPTGDNLETQKEFEFTTESGKEFPSGWTNRIEIRVDHNNVDQNLAGFPMLVDLTSDELRDVAQADGDDIFFTEDDALTVLPYELESYDDGHVVAWVKTDLSATQDTLIYMYFGNPSASSQATPEDVWDSDFMAVQHMEESAGTLMDSTGEGNDGIASGILYDRAGKINGAVSFDGVNDLVTMSNSYTTEPSFTFEAWINSNNKQGYALSQFDVNSVPYMGAFIQHYQGGSYQMYVGGSMVQGLSTVGQWHHVVGTYDGSTARLYIDGVQTGAAAATLDWPGLDMLIGDRTAGNRAYSGIMDEVRFSDVARSPAYVQASFLNQNNPSAFYDAGFIEEPATKPIVRNELPADDAIDVSPAISQVQFELFDQQGDLMDYTVTSDPDIGSDSGTGVGDGTIVVPVSGVQPNSEYTWTVEVTDGTETTVKEFVFTTQYTFDVNVVGSGSVDYTPGPYSYMQTVSLEAQPDSGWEFLGWAGDVYNDSASIDVVVDGEKSLTALFRDSGELIVDNGFEHSTDSSDLIYRAPYQNWYESRDDLPTILSLDETDIGGNSGVKAKFEQNGDDNAYLTQQFDAQDGEFALQWDVYVDTILDTSSPDRAAITMIGIDDGDSRGANYGAGNNFVWLGFYRDGGADNGTMDLVAALQTGEEIVIEPDMNLDQWYTLAVYGDVDSDTYDVFVDGSLIASGLTARTAQDNVTHISFAQWNDGAGRFYIDNVMEAAPLTCVDADNDTYSSTGGSCGPVDCDDSNAAINPGATEVCDDGIDNNCNSILDLDELICYGPDLLADSDFEASTDSADLRDNVNGQDWYESRGDEPGLAELDETDIGGNSGKKLFINGDESGDVYVSQEFKGEQAANFAVEYDIYVDEILDIDGNPDRTGWVMIGDDSSVGLGPNQANTERFVQLAFEMDGGTSGNGTMSLVARDRNDGWTAFTTVAENVSVNAWHHVRIDLDLDNDEYEVTMDGTSYGNVTSRRVKDSVTHISFVNMYDGAGKFYVDNVMEG